VPSDTRVSRADGSVRARRGAGLVLALQAVALVVAAGAQDPALRPVTAALGGGPRHLVSQVDVGLALAVVVALLAVARFLPSRFATWVVPLLTTPIAVFVIAELNGVEDVGALVGIYALASAGVMFRMLATASGRRARSYGAAVGIVPWGIVAFHQVGAGAVGRPLGGDIVLVTLVALAFAIGEFVFAWRHAETLATAARILGVSIVAWLVVAAI
jgi:hypothetical protein